MKSSLAAEYRIGRMLFLGALSLFAMAQQVMAQTSPGKSSPPEKSTASEKSPAAIDKRLETTAVVSDMDKLRRSTDMLNRSRQDLKDTLDKLEEARNSKDILKLNCVNERLTQIKGLLKVIEASDVALQEDIAKRESSAAEQEFTKESVAFRRLDGLRSEVEQCIGQLAYETGDQSVEFEIPPNLPNDDITRQREPPPPIVRPPPASPN